MLIQWEYMFIFAEKVILFNFFFFLILCLNNYLIICSINFGVVRKPYFRWFPMSNLVPNNGFKFSLYKSNPQIVIAINYFEPIIPCEMLALYYIFPVNYLAKIGKFWSSYVIYVCIYVLFFTCINCCRH